MEWLAEWQRAGHGPTPSPLGGVVNHKRLDRLAEQLDPDDGRVTFHRCEDHGDLTWDQHREFHCQRGEFLFTLNLGGADIRGTGDAA